MSGSNQDQTGKTPTGGKRAIQKPGARTGKALVLHRLYIALTIVSAVIVAGFIGWKLFAAAPDVVEKQPGGVDHTRPPQVTMVIDEETGEEVEVEIPGLSTDRKDRFYTFLLVGQSEETGGSLTDTMMLAAYDVANQSLKIMSLPRDTYVSYGGQNVLLNSIYNRGGGDKDEKGITALKREVGKLTGVNPDFYVVVQWKAFGELVDAIGGVYYDVPRDMQYWDPTQNLRINVSKGYQLLDGDKAMQVVRFRDGPNGYVDGDLGRIKTQQGFMKELVKKCLQPGVILTNLTSYIDIFQRNVNTDLTAGNLAYFAQQAVGGLDMDNVSFVTLPNKPAGSHLLPVASKIVEAVNDGFNPYRENIRVHELQVVTAVATPTPKATATPSASPTGSEPPASSGEPTESGAPVLPPEVSASGQPSHRPEDTAPPATHSVETELPVETPSEDPAQLPASEPPATQDPVVVQPPVSEEPLPPAETQEVPVFTPPPAPAQSDEPLLPPGV